MKPEQPNLSGETQQSNPTTRKTIQENPHFISDKELDDAYMVGKVGNFSYQDLIDNLTRTEEDLKFVTGGENRRELEKRRDVLKKYTKYEHPTTRIIREEDQKNFEGGMSFNEDQQFLIKILAGNYSHLDDYQSYLTVKDIVAKYKNLNIEDVVTDHDKRRTIPDKYKNINLGQLFTELFPQGEDK